MNQLHTLKCKACEGLEDKLSEADIQTYLAMTNGWEHTGTAIQKQFVFKNFKAVLSFVNKVAVIAEEEGHHPDMFIHGWNKLTITLSTFALKGLSMNDFIMATKIDRLD